VEPLKIFISSVMRRSLEDLSAERESARAAVEHFDPIACAWAFENEPASTKRLRDSYIDEVKTCDLMVLIVAHCVTPAVRDEFDTARDYNKGILAFAKEAAEREPDALEMLRMLDAKYDRFTSAEDLGPKVRHAVGLEIRRRAEPEVATGVRGDHLAYLRELKRTGRLIRIAPMIPHSEHDVFRVDGERSDLLMLTKSGMAQQITIPTPRIAEVLNMGESEAPLVRIEGRLQWITMRREWRFIHESPPLNDPFRLGAPKVVDMDYPRRMQLAEGSYGWSRRDLLAGRLSAGTHEVFYNEDGHYLQSGGAVLIVRA
jgi:hypothetical protein